MLLLTWLWMRPLLPAKEPAAAKEWADVAARAAVECGLQRPDTAKHSTRPEFARGCWLPCGRELWVVNSFVDCQTDSGEWVRISYMVELDCDQHSADWHGRAVWINGEQVYRHFASYDVPFAAL